MIIDFHTHTFPDKIADAAVSKLKAASNSPSFSDGTVSGLVSSMKKAGIDLSVVLPVATNPLKVSKINEGSAQMSGKDSLIYFGCIHPDCEDIKKEMKYIADLGLRGVKIHPVYQNTDIDDRKNLEILYAAGELDLIVVTHAGDDIGFPGVVRCSPKMIRNALRSVGGVKFVLAHMGSWNNWEEVPEYLSDTGVYIDTAFSLGKITPIDDASFTNWKKELLSDDEFTALSEAMGYDKVLFGSDSPWTDQAESVALIKNLPISEEKKNAILGGNAARLLGL